MGEHTNSLQKSMLLKALLEKWDEIYRGNLEVSMEMFLGVKLN